MSKMYKYTGILPARCINIHHNSVILVYLSPRGSPAANTWVLRGLHMCLTVSRLCHIPLPKPLSGYAKEPLWRHDSVVKAEKKVKSGAVEGAWRVCGRRSGAFPFSVSRFSTVKIFYFHFCIFMHKKDCVRQLENRFSLPLPALFHTWHNVVLYVYNPK